MTFTARLHCSLESSRNGRPDRGSRIPSKSAWSLLFIAGFLSFTNPILAGYNPEVIYGDDNRRDFATTSNPHLVELGRATALLTDKAKLGVTSNPQRKSLTSKSLQEESNLCSDQPFANQPVGGWCSGFLVGPDLLVTAGHCVQTTNCADIAVVFGFAYEQGHEDLTTVAAQDVYSCQSIVSQRLDFAQRGQDYAVIRLDRPVTGRTPLAIRRSGQVDSFASLAVIGHPSGLPAKIADHAYVRDNSSSDFFVTNTDSFGGNSGSAVIDVHTGVVEGILVRGERDYIYRDSCLVPNHCDNDACRGEDATRSTLFAEFVPEL